jgi:hypothetical protein
MLFYLESLGPRLGPKSRWWTKLHDQSVPSLWYMQRILGEQSLDFPLLFSWGIWSFIVTDDQSMSKCNEILNFLSRNTNLPRDGHSLGIGLIIYTQYL